MSYGNHTDCGLCRGHSVNCWCALWPKEVKGVSSAWCHEPDEHARQVKPGWILSIPRALTDEEYERIASRWRAEHAGGLNAHRTTYLGRHPLPWRKRVYFRIRRWLA